MNPKLPHKALAGLVPLLAALSACQSQQLAESPSLPAADEKIQIKIKHHSVVADYLGTPLHVFRVVDSSSPKLKTGTILIVEKTNPAKVEIDAIVACTISPSQLERDDEDQSHQFLNLDGSVLQLH